MLSSLTIFQKNKAMARGDLVPVHGVSENIGQFLNQLLQVFLVGLTIGAQRNVLPALAEQEFGLSANSYMLFMTFIVSFGFVKGAMNFLAGSLSEQWGRRPILLLGWCFALPIPFLFLYAPTWNWIIVANVLLGLNQGFAWSMTVTSKVDITKPTERGLATGWNEFSGYVGVALAGIATGYLAADYPPRETLFAFGLAVAAIGLLAGYLFSAETLYWARAETKGGEASGRMMGDPALRVVAIDGWSMKKAFITVSFQHRTLMTLCQAGLVEKFVDALVWAVYPLFLVQEGLGLVDIGWVVGCYGLSWGVNQLWTGKASDKVGRKSYIVNGMIICGVGVLIFPMDTGMTWWLVCAFISGLGMAMLYPTLIAAVGDVSPAALRGSIMGAYRYWRDTGYAIGALCIGFVADHFGRLEMGFYFVGGAMIVSGLLVALFSVETLTYVRGEKA